MPLVNAPSARRVILRMMRRERYRGSQLNRRADELFGRRASVCDFGDCARCRALWAPTGCALRWPFGRTEEVPCGSDVITPNIRLRDSRVNFDRVVIVLTTIA